MASNLTDAQWSQLGKALGRVVSPVVKLPADATLVAVKDDKAYWEAGRIAYVTNLDGTEARITPETVERTTEPPRGTAATPAVPPESKP